MNWITITSAAIAIIMLIMIFPGAMHQLKHGRKGTQQEWLGAIAVLGGVALFVWLLMKLV